MEVAILVDGSFFLKRYEQIVYRGLTHSGETKAKYLYDKLKGHWEDKGEDLYRILYYDCQPFGGILEHPVTKSQIDFSKTRTYKNRMEFYQALRKMRKVALRLGNLSSSDRWVIDPTRTSELINGSLLPTDLKNKEVRPDLKQKGVDIKIGLDIASIAFKGRVRQIVLVSGDSDFVPAAKLARREGVDFVLDPMWNHISDDLFEHIDGLHSAFPKPKARTKPKAKPKKNP